MSRFASPILVKYQSVCYAMLLIAGALAGWFLYPKWCPSDTSSCFRAYTLYISLAVTCVALLILNVWRFGCERLYRVDLSNAALTEATPWGYVLFLGRNLIAIAFGWPLGAATHVL